MEVNSVPGRFASAYAPAVYVVGGLAAGETADVEIVAPQQNRVLGVKRFYGEPSVAVNCAGYAARLLDVRPAVPPAAGMALAMQPSRTATVTIRIGSQSAAPAILTGGRRDAQVGALLSGAPQQALLSPGEWDELSVVTDGGTVTAAVTARTQRGDYTLFSGTLAGQSGVCTLTVDGGRVEAALEERGVPRAEWGTVVARVAADGAEPVSRTYRMAAERTRGVRLCWVNEYGGVDYYTFALERERRYACDRSRIRTAGGWRTVGMEAQRSRVLLSEYVPRQCAEWLAGILASPRVWTADAAGVREADVVSDSVEVSGVEMCAVAVEIRAAKEEPVQMA